MKVVMFMQKLDATVRKETKYIAVWVIIFSAIMEAVFLIIGKWDYTVLLGNLLSGTVVVLNFLFMGITIQNAVQKDEKDAKSAMKLSQTLRTLFLFVAVIIGAALPCFSIWSTIIPLFFPRIAIALRPLWHKESKAEEVKINEE